MYKLKILGQEYDKVQGSENWTKNIQRDFNDRIFRTYGEMDFTGWQSLFSLLYSNVISNGACNALEGRVYFRESKYQDYLEIFRGELKPQDQSFDLINQSVEAQILEDTWAARFRNSEDQKVFLRSTESKDQSTILSCLSDLCDFYTPTTGTYDKTGRRCYRVKDIFTFLIDYHTNGQASFASTFFNNGGDGEQYYITTGKEIRLGDGSANPEISFSELFDELNKKFNLWIIIESDDYDNPVLRIEDFNYVFNQSKILEVENPEGIELQIDLDQLYTIVEVGSNAVEYNGTDANYPNVRFQAWNEESYNTGGCEFENNTLDLVSNYLIDSNSIEQSISGIDDFDDNIFIVEINPTTLEAVKHTTELTSSDTVLAVYNYSLRNEQVITNWFDGIPQQIQKDIGAGYYVYVDSPTIGFATSAYEMDYSNDSTSPAIDLDDIYTTAAESAGFDTVGEFKFIESAYYSYKIITNIGAGGFRAFRMIIRIYDDNQRNNVLRTITGPWINTAPTTSPPITLEGNTFISADNVAVVSIEPIASDFISYLILAGSAEFKSEPTNYKATTEDPLIYVYDVSKFKLGLTDWQTIENNLGYVRFIDTKTNRYWDLWAKEINYNPTTQIVQGEWIGRQPVVDQLCWILGGEGVEPAGFWDDTCYWDDAEILNDGDWFIITVKTDNVGVSANDEFKIQTDSGGYTYDYVVDWGDGNIESGFTGDTTHTYSTAGTYTVKINGIFPTYYVNNADDRLKILSIEQWGPIAWQTMTASFFGCDNIQHNAIDSPNLSSVTLIPVMFTGCTALTGNTYINNWDVSTITNFNAMFKDCPAFNVDVGSWDTSSATFLNNLFSGCTAFDQDISTWNTANTTSFAAMFKDATSFNRNIGGWNVGNATTMQQMLQGATAFDQDISGWDTSSVTDMRDMLNGATAFDQDIGAWDISSVTTASNFMNGAGLSTANYDALLTGWTGWTGGAATRPVQSNVIIDFGSSQYSLGSDADDARAWLQAAPQNWTITDGGGV